MLKGLKTFLSSTFAQIQEESIQSCQKSKGYTWLKSKFHIDYLLLKVLKREKSSSWTRNEVKLTSLQTFIAL